jgi:Ca2+-binding RTX toxin-like protein
MYPSRRQIKLLPRRVQRSGYCALESLECRTLLAVNPSGREQEMLELTNRMRMNPQAELNLLINSGDADVNSAVSYFKVNKTVLAQQWSSLTPVPPLAWNSSLQDAARLHSQAMLDADMQSHQVPGEAPLGTRLSNAGYKNLTAGGENVYAYAKSVFHGHAGFAIDWGEGPHGIQDPPGHRDNIMSTSFREVGISIINSTSGKSVGPMLITQDFGNRSGYGNPAFLGVAFDDKNGDGFYNAGEGLSGVVIELEGSPGSFVTTTMSAGGYQIKVPAGTYKVTASGGGLDGTIVLNSVTVGSNNVKRDFLASNASFAILDGGLLRIDGTNVADNIKLTNSGSNLVVNRNGQTQSFTRSTISRIEIYSADGNDVIDFRGIWIPTYVNAGTGNDLVYGGHGNDTLTGGAGSDTLYGGDGNDRINGFAHGDFLYGEGGDDRIYGGAGHDLIDGGSGVDRIWGEADNDTLIGGGSNDKILGGDGDDLIYGGRHNDWLDGGPGNDSLFGQDGDDILLARDFLADFLDGGEGNDKAQVDVGVDTLVSIEELLA